MSEEPRLDWWERPFTTFRLIEGIGKQSDWGDVLSFIAGDAWSRYTRGSDVERDVRRLVQDVRVLDERLALHLEATMAQQLNGALRYGSMMGYALAVTWPGSIADLDAWAQQALDYVNAHTKATEG